MQKVFTLYPSSDIVAEAEAPANPVPTTITVCLRLLAGFTSFMSNLCFDHLSSSVPPGIFESSFIAYLPAKKKT